MFVVGFESSRSITVLAEAAASEIGAQTSEVSEPLRSVMRRNPNSLRVGKVSETFPSSVNQPPYDASHPMATAKFCCAERARLVAATDGSTVAASIVSGFVTVTKLSEQATAATSAAPSAVRVTARRIAIMVIISRLEGEVDAERLLPRIRYGQEVLARERACLRIDFRIGPGVVRPQLDVLHRP